MSKLKNKALIHLRKHTLGVGGVGFLEPSGTPTVPGQPGQRLGSRRRAGAWTARTEAG